MKIEITNAKEMELSEDNLREKSHHNMGVVITDCGLKGYGGIIDIIVAALQDRGIVADIKLIEEAKK